jgi:hypothetical protein
MSNRRGDCRIDAALLHVERELPECSWCGAPTERPYMNREGEVFCSSSHRSSSNRAKKRFIERNP